MPNQLTALLESIKKSRSDVIASIANLSTAEGNKKPDPDRWNIQEVIEHLVLAERGGFDLIYTAAERFRMGDPVWVGESANDGLTIEAIIEKTWKPKEIAPPSATPTGKWSLGVWSSHFKNCDDLLTNLNHALAGLPLDQVIYPHFLCGPLNAIQRLEFIRFHIDRHIHQIADLKNSI